MPAPHCNPCLHQPQPLSSALWSHHSRYNGASAAPSWDFIHARTHTYASCALVAPLLHAGFITTKLCMHQENKSAWTRWQERAHQRSHKMHKKNNIKEIWMKLCITGVSALFFYFAHINWYHCQSDIPNIQIVQPAAATSVIQRPLEKLQSSTCARRKKKEKKKKVIRVPSSVTISTQ